MNHIPLDHAMVARARAIIPAEFHQYTWIAGSAATRFSDAWEAGGDVDVWVCCNGVEWKEYDRLWRLLTDLGKYPSERRQDEYLTDSDLVYADARLHILTTRQTVTDVISNFDISCHAGAVNISSGVQVLAGDYNPAVRINRFRDARRTLTRGCKFAIRYHDTAFWVEESTRRCASVAFMEPGLVVGEGL